MKRTLIFTAVTLVLAAPVNVYSQATVVSGTVDGTNAAESPDDSIGFVDDKAVVDTGAYTSGALSPAINSPTGSYISNNVASDNIDLTNGFNDSRSDNVTAIGEDGIVAHASDLDQVVATNDFNTVIGGGAETASGTKSGEDGNLILIDASHTKGALAPSINSNSATGRTDLNEISAGSFNTYGGIATVGQNLGSSTSVQQSIVVQSNGQI